MEKTALQQDFLLSTRCCNWTPASFCAYWQKKVTTNPTFPQKNISTTTGKNFFVHLYIPTILVKHPAIFYFHYNWILEFSGVYNQAGSESRHKSHTTLPTSINYSVRFAVEKCLYLQYKFIPQPKHIKGRVISGCWRKRKFFNIALWFVLFKKKYYVKY